MLCACSDDENYDVKGNPDNLVYFKANAENTFTGTVTHTPVGDFGEVKAAFPVRILRPASRDTKVTASIDTTLISAYNEAHGTSYVAAPDGCVSFDKATVTIL